MADFSVSLKGMDKLERKLQNMNSIRLDAVQKKQLTQMLNRARQPGGTPVDTGELRKSSGVAGDEMGYSEEYAPHVEFGHRTLSGGFVPGQRFLQKNVETQQSIYRDDLLNAIRKE